MISLEEPTTKKAKTDCTVLSNREAQKAILGTLNKRLEDHDDSRKKLQEELGVACSELKKQLDEMYERINSELQVQYTEEDDRLQEMLNRVREFEVTEENNEEFTKVLQKARADLALMKSYELFQEEPYDFSSLFTLHTEKKAVNEFIDLEKPEDFRVTENAFKQVHLDFSRNEAFEDTLSRSNSENSLYYEALLKKKDTEDDSKLVRLEKDDSNSFLLKDDSLEVEETYLVKVRAAFSYEETCEEGEWSDEVEFTTPEFSKCCAWREWSEEMGNGVKYSVNANNPRIVESCCMDRHCSVVTGNTFLPQEAVTSWNVRLLNMTKDGRGILIGVIPFDEDNKIQYDISQGLFFDCYNSILRKGLSEVFGFEAFSKLRDENRLGMYMGDTIGVIVDTIKGELSFAFNGINFGVVFEEIPIDKPLLPCVIFQNSGDSVELDMSEVELSGSSSVPVPINITTSSSGFDSITLRWDPVEGASFYQVEVDEKKLWHVSKTNEFTTKGLIENTEHTFRVRTVKENLVSEWSDHVNGKPQKKTFADSMWKECPDYTYTTRKYVTFGEYSRVAKKIDIGKTCIITGNTFIPLNEVTSWNVKIRKSFNNAGFGIFIGVAPADINHNENDAIKNCGWYFGCYSSTLWSGAPHKYKRKDYGPKKDDGNYVHMGSAVGVTADTTKGEISFALDGVDYGVAYAGVPLDKPLVPCVVLENKNDSVELLI